MGKIAFVFPGQGAQYPGMGESLYNTSLAAKEMLDTLESVRPGTKRQCFSGSDEELKDTSNSQPCIFAVSMMAAAAINERGITPAALAGFSLGEVTALTQGGAFFASEGMKLVTRRGQIMGEAAQSANSAMVAVLKLDAKHVEQLASKFEQIYPVNYNCPGQTVVAGEAEALKLFCDAVKAAGGRTIPLKVSGGFHSPFMFTAAENFRHELENYSPIPLKTPVWSNFNAAPYENDIKNTLTHQMKSPVRWQETIERMVEIRISTFIELGPGKTLKGLIEKCTDRATAFSIEDEKSLREVCAQLGE
jgi:[acyl-carrier-protein] S-malonyltransferase